MERQPLLDGMTADPPIDDDDYNYEDQKFPTQLQVHLIYAVYVLSILVSRVWEACCPLLIAVIFSKNYIAVSLYAALTSLLGSFFEQHGRRMLGSTPRYKLMRNALLLHRVAPFLAAIILGMLFKWTIRGWYRYVAAVVVMVLLVIGRASTVTQLTSLESDWTHIMSNEQSGVYRGIVNNLQMISVMASIMAPIIGGVLVQNLWVEMSLRIMRFALGMSLLVEFSLIWQLYSTCYALSVPRPYQTDLSANVGSLTPEITVKRVFQYIWLKPRPVLCSLGILLLKSNMLVIGPQFIFYFINNSKMPLWVVSLLQALQICAYLSPAIVSAGVASVVNFACFVGTVSLVVAKVPEYGYAIALLIILSRGCLQVLDITGQWYIEDLVNDKSVLAVFHKTELSSLRAMEVATQCLTLIWHNPNAFQIPVMISGSLGILGLVIFTSSRYSSATWHI